MSKAKMTRSTWSYGDNYELWIDHERVESESTRNFTVNGFLVVFCKKHGLDKDEVKICEGVDDLPRPTKSNHQSLLMAQPPAAQVYDPRIESNDLDPEEWGSVASV